MVSHIHVGSEKVPFLSLYLDTVNYFFAMLTNTARHTQHTIQKELVNHQLFADPTLLKRDLHMVLPQTSPDFTPPMQSFKSYFNSGLCFVGKS